MSSPTFELKNEIYKAGAGAGKTTKLTQQVIDVAESFLAQNQKYPHIVVTTFTRKATQELKERLLLKACEEEKLELLDYFSSQQRIHISTIHGVLSLFLRRYGHLFELDNNFQLINSEIAKSIFKDQLRAQLKKNPEVLEYFSFNELLKNIIDFYPIYFEHQKVQPPSVEALMLCLKKRWSDFKTEILKCISSVESQSDNEKWIQYVDVLKKVLGLKVEDIYSALSNLPRAPVERKNKTVGEDTKKQLSKLISDAKKMFSSQSYNPENWPSLISIYEKFYELAKDVCENVMQEKIKSSNLEMQDLELLTLKIILQEPEIANEFSKEWDYWLVDEYQDTSPIQVEILKHFISDRPHFTVGDPQQSIYLFRGADVSVFKNKQEFVKSTGGKTNELLKNYRSDPELLEFFNDIFTKLSGQFIRMNPKSDEFDSSKVVANIFKLEEPELELQAIGSEIVKLYQQKVPFEDICVLARKNDDLLKIANYFDTLKIPYNLHQSGGFTSRREVLDVACVLKFLANPYDNHNFLSVLRTPWFRVADEHLVEISQKSKKYKSYWLELSNIEINDVRFKHVLDQLNSYIEALKEKGYVQILEEIIEPMVDWAYFEDSSGLKEANILKFLYQLKMAERQPSFNVIEFLSSFGKKEDVEQASANSNATSSIEPSRVQLMTVHASKGLQFGYVFLPFLGTKPLTPKKSGVLFEKNSKVFSFAVSGVTEMERFGSPVEDLVVIEQKQRESEEFLRVFYVALTRAKKQVCLTWSKVDKNSWAYQLQDIFIQSINTNKYSYKVLSEVEQAKPIIHSKGDSNKLTELVTNDTSKVLASRYSVSDVVAMEGSSSTVLSVESNWKNKLKPVLFGIEFHSCLEAYKYNPLETLQNLKVSNLEIYNAINYLNQQKEFPFNEICKSGHVEWGFQMLIGEDVVEGQVDLWGQVNNEVWVVDYKTGSSKSYKKSLRQLKIYALAIQKHINPELIKIAAVYPFEQKLFVESCTNLSEEEKNLIKLLKQSKLV